MKLYIFHVLAVKRTGVQSTSLVLFWLNAVIPIVFFLMLSRSRVRMYVTYSKSKILQIAVLDYFLTRTLTNILFQFPEYVKQLRN